MAQEAIFPELNFSYFIFSFNFGMDLGKFMKKFEFMKELSLSRLIFEK